MFCRAVWRRVEAFVVVRNLTAPGWERERISRRRVGRGEGLGEGDKGVGEVWSGWEMGIGEGAGPLLGG